jgi:hypothetical protein
LTRRLAEVENGTSAAGAALAATANMVTLTTMAQRNTRTAHLRGL